MTARLIDLSHPLRTGTPVFPGDPRVKLTAEAGAGWQVTRLHLGSHSGTHVDAFGHLQGAGVLLDEIPLDRFQGSGWLVSVRDPRPDAPIEVADLDWGARRMPRIEGAMVVLRTGWSRHWGTPAYRRHPHISRELCEALVEWRVGLVGVDALNVDSTPGQSMTAHRALLGSGVLIAENLTNLEALGSPGRWWFSMLPLRLEAGDGSPVRAVAAALP